MYLNNNIFIIFNNIIYNKYKYNFTINIMDIFVISLKKSLNRRKEFDRLNKNINYEYFDAIDGETCIFGKEIVNSNSLGYSKQAIGCAISHLSLWNKCIELDKPIIIMEDDAFVSYDFEKHIDYVFKMLPENWHILQLCYNCDSILGFSNTNFENAYSFFTKKKINDKDIHDFQNSKINPTVAKLNMSFGAGCYAITPNGAKLLKKECFPMDNRIINIPLVGQIKAYTVDCMMNSCYTNLNAFVCPIPFVMTKHLHVNYESTITK